MRANARCGYISRAGDDDGAVMMGREVRKKRWHGGRDVYKVMGGGYCEVLGMLNVLTFLEVYET